jgi:alpha-glucosidase
MRNIPIRRKADVLDPIGRTFWPFHKGRDGCRAPMQWSAANNAGFSETDPWLPVNANYPTRNVINQNADPDSTLNFFKRLVTVRKAEPALQRGTFKALTKDPHHILAFERSFDDERLAVVLNFSSRELDYDLPDGEWEPVFGEASAAGQTVHVRPYQVLIFKGQ